MTNRIDIGYRQLFSFNAPLQLRLFGQVQIPVIRWARRYGVSPTRSTQSDGYAVEPLVLACWVNIGRVVDVWVRQELATMTAPLEQREAVLTPEARSITLLLT